MSKSALPVPGGKAVQPVLPTVSDPERQEQASRLFIELYTFKASWFRKPKMDRIAYMEGVVRAIDGLGEAGIEVIGYGINTDGSQRRASYDFFCVYRLPNAATQRELEQQIENSGWFDFVDQVHVNGDVTAFADALMAQARSDESSLQKAPSISL